MMIRRRSLPKLPAWFNGIFHGDYAIQVLLAERGEIGFLPGCMAVHRKHAGGASRIFDTDPDFTNAMLLKLHVALNRHFDYRFASILDPYIEHERLLADAAKRFPDVDDLTTSTAVALALDEFVPDSGRLFQEAGGRVAIVTSPTPWAYGARLVLHGTYGAESAERRAYAIVRMRVEGSTVGIGVLNRAADQFLDRRSVDPSEGTIELRLRIPELQAAGDLVVQTWAAAEPGTVHVQAVELVVFGESSAAALSL